MASSVSLCTILLLLTAVYCFDFPEPPNYDWATQTDLDRYVQSDDGYFRWSLISTTDLGNSTFYVLNMTSQKWIDETFSSRSIWWHYVGIAVPRNLNRKDIAALFIQGGSNNDPPPTVDSPESQVTVQAAIDTGTVCAYIKQVPNQPIVFYNDPSGIERSEDSLIAWSWVSFIQNWNTPTANSAYPLRNPMTKAVKRGLDTLNQFVKTVITDSDLTSFVVTGASKRGWTTWSIAVTDQRVVAIAPLVFSLLHMEETTMTQYRALNQKWSFALDPYWRENLTQGLLEPAAYAPTGLYDFEDIYRYRARLTIPKLSVAATGDELFFPQDFHSWWVNVTAPKYLMMLPNTDHLMIGQYSRIYDTVISFYEYILLDGGASLPSITWTRTEDANGGEILFTTNPPPRTNPDSVYDVTAWESITLNTDDRRDFRLLSAAGTHIVPWNTTTVELVSAGVFRSYINRDNTGEWVAHFVEGTWNSPSGRSMHFTSEVNYVPTNSFPGAACNSAAECWGSLI